MNSGFGDALRAVRTSRGVTQAELARSARIARTTLIRVEAGARPRQGVHHALVAALGFSYADELHKAAAALTAPHAAWPGSTRA